MANMYEEYGLDTSAEGWEEVKEQVEHLDLDAVEDILSRRRRPSDPSEDWLMWQNALKQRQGVLRAPHKNTKVKEEFYEIMEEYDTYGYVCLDSQDWLVNTLKKLLGGASESDR